MVIALSLFILRERERAHMSRGGAERKRERERAPSKRHAVNAEPDEGLELTNREIMTYNKIESQTLNQLSHPVAPIFAFLPAICKYDCGFIP